MQHDKHPMKSFKLTVKHSDTSATIESEDTNVYDLSAMAIIAITIIMVVYLATRKRNVKH